MEYWGHIEKTNQTFMSYIFKGLKSQYFDLLFKRRNVLKMRPDGAFLEVIGYSIESHTVVYQSSNNVSKLTEVVYHSSAELKASVPALCWITQPTCLQNICYFSRDINPFSTKSWLWPLKSVDFFFSTWP